MQVMSAIEMRDNGTFQNFGAEYVATHAAFTMPLNTISDPIRGTRAWFIMVVDNRKEADMKGFEGAKLDLMRTSASQRRGNAYYTWFRNYRENSEIEDLRGKRN
jgi:parvulin-like peptidyl-prolyl isomerase